MKKEFSKNNLASLYEQDYYQWLVNTAEFLRSQRLSELDLANLLEEIESMGRSEKSALESNLVVVLLHLIKWKYQPSMRSNSWKGSIREHRRRLRKALQNSPSLQPYLLEVFDECYHDGREQAADETGLALEYFPVESPFSVEESLNPDFLPE